MAVSPRDIHSVFSQTVQIQDEDLLEKCTAMHSVSEERNAVWIGAHLCRIFQCTAEDLHNKWESFTFQMQQSGGANAGNDDQDAAGDLPMTAEWFEKFKQHLQRERGKGLLHSSGGGAPGKMPRSSPVALSSLSMNTMQSSGASSGVPASGVHNKTSFESMMSSVLSQRKPGGKLSLGATNATPKSVKSIQMTPNGKSPFGASPLAITPLKWKQQNTSMASPQAQKFLERDNSGKVEFVLNSHVQETKSANGIGGSATELAIFPGYLTEGRRYMYEKLSEKSLEMNKHIQALGNAIVVENGIDDVGNPGSSSQSEIATYGRICSESEGRMNESSLILESSREVGNGCRVPLKLGSVHAYNFFPGQVVGLKGINNGGSSGFHVSEILPTPLQEKASTSVSELYQYNYGTKYLDGSSLRVHVVAGPYTLDGSLTFEPFKCMMEAVNEQPPDVFIVMGPFVDESHPEIVAGRVEASLEEIFVQEIAAPLYQFAASFPKSRVILVPSTKDILHPFQVFPQPPLEQHVLMREMRAAYKRDHPNIEQRISCLPNPCLFVINEIYFALSTVDILFHLNSEEISRFPPNAPKSDRMARMAKYILEQRNFYPLCPPNGTDSQVDFTHQKYFELPLTPDVLILPSRLVHFAKMVEGVLVVNPGPLCRQQSGGTYVRLTVNPLPKENFPEHILRKHGRDAMQVDSEEQPDEGEDEQTMYHAIDLRTRVEIVRV